MTDPATNVVRLVDVAPGFASQSEADLVEFGKNWLDALGGDQYDPLKSVIVLVETRDGGTCLVSQSMEPLDTDRLLGLLYRCAHRRLDGKARPADIEVCAND